MRLLYNWGSFILMPKDLKLINPNTGNCPIFRSKRDAEITKRIYQRVPVLLNEKNGENPWGISFQTMFHMSNDSNLFETYSNLIEKDYTLEGNVFVKGEDKWLPLYEAKMVWHYDHRFNTYLEKKPISTTKLEHQNPEYYVNPQYYVKINNIDARLGSYSKNFLLGWRDITNATNKRTVVASFIPKTAVGHTFLLIFLEGKSAISALICANLNSIVFDYCARQKTGGTHISYNIMKQLPIIPPQNYSINVKFLIIQKVIELVYSSNDMDDFAKDMLNEIGEETWNFWFPENPVKNGKVNPFVWDEERRFTLQRELDAIYVHLYGLSKPDLTYILDTFPIVEKNDVEKYGFFKSKEDVLKYYDEYSEIQSYSS